jgi:selenocysteine-specific elongation factor
MKRLIMCTAGHVDHGKTTLVRTLTGIDCDTHPEEKRRGITINPGFAYLDLPAENGPAVRLGIVDVPGHHRFIRNMLAGACGVDFALLVVAADDGVMPQTHEHLALLGLLGVKDGLVCLSKTDLATPELLDLAYQDVRDALGGSCLEHAEIVPVSAQEGTGLAETCSAIRGVVARVADRSCDGPFRMYIDRVFSVAGFGTVVTGSILSGRVRQNDSLFILPRGIAIRVRRIECHGKQVAEASAGERASLNVLGFDPSTFEHGMMLADRLLPVTHRFDGELTVVGQRTRLRLHNQALLYTGTQQTSCRIHLLDCNEAQVGGKSLAQIELERPCVLLPGDRFILRNASKDATVGGGVCVDPHPLHHKRRTGNVVEQLRRRVAGGLAAAVVSEAEKWVTPGKASEIANAIGCTETRIREVVFGLSGGQEVTSTLVDGELYLHGCTANGRLLEAARRCVAQYHRDDPLGTRGIMPLQIAGKLGLPSAAACPLAESLLVGLVRRGILRQTDRGGYVLATFVAKDSGRLREAVGFTRQLFAGAGMSVLSLAKIEYNVNARFRLGAKEVRAVLSHLVEEGEILPVDDGYVNNELVARCRLRLLRHLVEHDGGISVAEFRDLVDGNRRICLDLLAVYDREGMTRRQGDLRFATDSGRAFISQNSR